MLVNKKKLVRMIAKRAGFTIGDSQVLLDTLIEILEEAVLHKWNFRVGGLGIIKYAEFKSGKKMMPISGVPGEFVEKNTVRSERIYFALSENITGKSRDRLRAEEIS